MSLTTITKITLFDPWKFCILYQKLASQLSLHSTAFRSYKTCYDRDFSPISHLQNSITGTSTRRRVLGAKTLLSEGSHVADVSSLEKGSRRSWWVISLSSHKRRLPQAQDEATKNHVTCRPPLGFILQKLVRHLPSSFNAITQVWGRHHPLLLNGFHIDKAVDTFNFYTLHFSS